MFEGSNLVNVYFGQRPTCDNLVIEAKCKSKLTTCIYWYRDWGPHTLGPPPCIFMARTVATSTTQFGIRPKHEKISSTSSRRMWYTERQSSDIPLYRHFILKNFSIPMSAPKPASVTGMNRVQSIITLRFSNCCTYFVWKVTTDTKSL